MVPLPSFRVMPRHMPEPMLEANEAAVGVGVIL